MKDFTNIIILPSILSTGESSLETLKAYRFEGILKHDCSHFSARLPRGWHARVTDSGTSFYDEAGYLIFVAYVSESGKPFIHVIKEPERISLDPVWIY